MGPEVVKLNRPLLCLVWVLVATAQPQSPKRPELRPAEVERRVHDLINAERAAEKLGSLQLDEQLSKVARTHSEDMARRDYFDHINPEGLDPAARGKAAGYTCRKVTGNTIISGLAENIFQGNLYDRYRVVGTEKVYDWNSAEELAKQSITAWMNSPPHRQNVLGKGYGKTGIGIAIAPDDKVYFTQLFC